MFIMNERIFIEDLIKSETDIRDFDVSNKKIISLLCKYYRNYDKVYTGLIYIYKDVKDFYVEKHLKDIDSILKDTITNDWKLRERDCIEIYQSDIDKISTLETNREKKVMFSLIVLARYYNIGGITNVQDSKSRVEFFKLANVVLNIKDRGKLLHKLFEKGLITMSKNNMKNNIKVLNIVNDGDVVLRVYDMKNLGSQYMEYIKS